jgi:hypothetical protein
MTGTGKRVNLYLCHLGVFNSYGGEERCIQGFSGET